MKSIDFSKMFEPLTSKMGIDDNLRDNSYAKTKMIKQELSWKDTLRVQGIDATLHDIEIYSDGTLYYNDEQIAVYIRDQANYSNYDSNYKFHVAWCATLQSKHRDGTYEKYVVSNRSDGKFLVNTISSKGVNRDTEKELKVCKKCLAKLNWENYRFKNHVDRNNICDNFSLKDFFAKRENTTIHIIPKYKANEAPLNNYNKHWNEKASMLKKTLGYICYNCGKDYTDTPHQLHVHHLNSIKSDDSPSNMIPLCEKCHATIHPHMRGLIK